MQIKKRAVAPPATAQRNGKKDPVASLACEHMSVFCFFWLLLVAFRDLRPGLPEGTWVTGVGIISGIQRISKIRGHGCKTLQAGAYYVGVSEAGQWRLKETEGPFPTSALWPISAPEGVTYHHER